jgi:adenosine deaminase
MHAGELTLGLVRPEDLTWHINDALFIASAQRIGHGVDLPYEVRRREILEHMRRDSIPVELNLTSNEFILVVSHDRHPILHYVEAHVPIVISTDDVGILRSDLTNQFVLLAKRYPTIRYKDIRQFILNSITYGFIKDEALKNKMMLDLGNKLNAFERDVVK